MNSNVIQQKAGILLEIIFVLAIMHGTKMLAQYVHLPSPGTFGIWVGILAATFIFKRRSITWKSIGLQLPKGHKDWLTQIGIGILAILSIVLITILTLYVFKPAFGLEKAADAADKFNFFLGKPLILLVYLIVGIWFGAGLGEELLIRGFLLNHLKNLFGSNKSSWIIALILQAVIFGFMHSYQGSMGILITGLIGLSFGIFYLANKRKLFPVIFAHALFDTLTMVGYYLAESGM